MNTENTLALTECINHVCISQYSHDQLYSTILYIIHMLVYITGWGPAPHAPLGQHGPHGLHGPHGPPPRFSSDILQGKATEGIFT